MNEFDPVTYQLTKIFHVSALRFEFPANDKDYRSTFALEKTKFEKLSLKLVNDKQFFA